MYEHLTTEEILSLPYSESRFGYAILHLHGHPCSDGQGRARRARVVAFNAGLLVDLELQVHHKDHDKLNDVPENFEIMSCGEHTRMHMRGNQHRLGVPHTEEFKRWQAERLRGNQYAKGKTGSTVPQHCSICGKVNVTKQSHAKHAA